MCSVRDESDISEAEALRRENERLRGELDLLRARLAALQRHGRGPRVQAELDRRRAAWDKGNLVILIIAVALAALVTVLAVL
ncbi:MAG: hypothetical protein AMK73_05385 [Planctomycetes bacterium SM23_32]|nr:MAG: hypothetical protein AMK73_05385 [Planctomycetes bacterium SM23_32]